MKQCVAGVALGLAAVLASASAVGQSRSAVATHKSAAKRAAGEEWGGLYTLLCAAADRPARPSVVRDGTSSGPEAAPEIPDRAQWHHEPAKIFDNLYFVGMNDVAAWAVTTSQGIILIDALSDFAVEDEVVGGLTKLGLDPRQIKYVLISHGHVTHFGGAKFLQDTYGAKIGVTAADWTLIEETQRNQPTPKRDMVVTDGQKLTLGDTTITMHITPGHTEGAISFLIPVTDKGKPHVVALSGIGTASGEDNLQTQIESSIRFFDLVGKAKADVLLSDEDRFSNYIERIDQMAAGRATSAGFIVGTGAVRRYLVVVRECGLAVLSSM